MAKNRNNINYEKYVNLQGSAEMITVPALPVCVRKARQGSHLDRSH